MDTTVKPTQEISPEKEVQDYQNYPGVIEGKDGWYLPLSLIVPNRQQPRDRFNLRTIQELAQSIRRNGLLQTPAVRFMGDGKYEIIFGERRFRAHQWLSEAEKDERYKIMRIKIYHISDAEAFEISVSENRDRDNLNPIEEARCCRRFRYELGYTLEKTAQAMGFSIPTVSLRLLLLEFAEEVGEIQIGNERRPLVDLVAEGKIPTTHVPRLMQFAKNPEDKKAAMAFIPKMVAGKIPFEQAKAELLDLKRKRLEQEIQEEERNPKSETPVIEVTRNRGIVAVKVKTDPNLKVIQDIHRDLELLDIYLESASKVQIIINRLKQHPDSLILRAYNQMDRRTVRGLSNRIGSVFENLMAQSDVLDLLRVDLKEEDDNTNQEGG